MSRSYKKTPICKTIFGGMTPKDKKYVSRYFRRKLNQRFYEDVIFKDGSFKVYGMDVSWRYDRFPRYWRGPIYGDESSKFFNKYYYRK